MKTDTANPDRVAGRDHVVEILDSYRGAARRIVRTDSREKTRILALLDLSARARRDARAPRAMVDSAIWAEARVLIEGEPAIPGDPSERACRHLRVQGFERCPTCRMLLPTHEQLDQWDQQRTDRIEELERFEGAVS